MVAVNYILRGHALLTGLYGDGHTVLVTASDHDYIFAFEAQIAYVNIGRDIYAGEVSDMHRTVGIRESCGNESALEFLFHM